ncbi:hypothetical protein HDC92_004305 [Pedobacter sp. AK017]|uniref:restriction endonuclease n=1 Tax=Pedobacter sp. AK017 TaxID=2723073 RepID=UPI001622D119|nr:restriction endonuclease [Pedobacter sp. AK017]MBB5440602.1 hypothetical protein [Pedobacter sp. AK017]
MAEDNNTGLDWKGYEEITKYIYEMLGAGYGIKIKSYGTKSKVRGKSGVKHQIDVLTEQIVGDKVLLTAIECKYLKKKVTKKIVMELSEIMRDADISSGIIVTKTGFTPDTLTYADHLGIKLVELREAGQNEKKGGENVEIGTLEINARITIKRTKIVSIDLGSLGITDEDELMMLRFPGHAFILTPDGRKIAFDQFVNAYCVEVGKREQLLKTITLAFPHVNGKLIRNYCDAEAEIKKMEFSGFLAEIDASSKKSFQLVDQVWMIMKEIFEKNTFKLSKGGLLFRDAGES